MDPLKTGQKIVKAYASYLKTNHRLADERIRREFETALDRFSFSKGPYLHSAKRFEYGKSISNLIEDGTLHERFLQLPADAFPIERNLYVHQEDAITKILRNRNVVVATGTGSGKTECFLLPILQHLFMEQSAGTLEKPGVRALLLYPMNALANDQLSRIESILATYPEITFGRYTGETSHESIEKATQDYISRVGVPPPPNKLICREQIQEAPPHILLTNYAMLEYLLLRPKDSSLFDGPTGDFWKFICLDELHVYSGAQGAEIAMLLRRVKDRVAQSEVGRMQFIGTSATLGSGESQIQKVSEFASSLFGEKVEYDLSTPSRQDLIRPSYRNANFLQPSWSLNSDAIAYLHDAVSKQLTSQEVAEYLSELDAPQEEIGSSLENYLSFILQRESTVVGLQRLLYEQELLEVESAANLSQEIRQVDVYKLIEICSAISISNPDLEELLPAKYHYFLRALEGSFACFSKQHPDTQPSFFLNRKRVCEACLGEGIDSQIFEVALCSSCGATYLVGKISGDSFVPARTTEQNLTYLLTDHENYLDADEEDQDEGANFEHPENFDVSHDRYDLCLACGALLDGSSECDCNGSQKLPVRKVEPKDGQRNVCKCISCSKISSVPIVKRFLGGGDRDQSVIATTMYQSLPDSREETLRFSPGRGRKLLAFADSRQSAAFFAPTLSQQYQDVLHRKLILECLEENQDALSFSALSASLKNKVDKLSLFSDMSLNDTDKKREVEKWIVKEIVSGTQKESLINTGLVTISVPFPTGFAVPSALLNIGFSEQEVRNLVSYLLESLRLQRVISPPNLFDDSDLTPQEKLQCVRLTSSGSEYGVVSWVPSSNHKNVRIDYLQKVFDKKRITENPRTLLQEIWENWFSNPGANWDQILTKKETPHGLVREIEIEKIEFTAVRETDPVKVCNTCRKISFISIEDVCHRFRCLGTLVDLTLEQMAENYYYSLIKNFVTVDMDSKEHTGQLSSKHAASVQNDFINGKINTLSASTTFELGIDVGEVQSVFMRNIPPAPSNYVQRAGRAGRRIGAPALITTFATRAPHDLQQYDRPEQLIKGENPPPIISLSNQRIVRRHLHSVAFAAFERRHVDTGGEEHKTVSEFFSKSDNDEASPVDDFIEWLETYPPELNKALKRICPEGLQETVGLADNSWVEKLVTESSDAEHFGELARAKQNAEADIESIENEIKRQRRIRNELEESGKQQAADKIASRIRRLGYVENTLKGRKLLEYFANTVVIPKYGFPIDVAEMVVPPTSGNAGNEKLKLHRDLSLAITDYAPGEETIAAGATWVSTGIKVLPNKANLEFEYWWCANEDCGEFIVRRAEIGHNQFICSCGGTEKRDNGKFIQPQFGFLGKLHKDKVPSSRPFKRTYAESYFGDYSGEVPEFESHPYLNAVQYRRSAQGQITVITKKPGFMVCKNCGYAERRDQVEEDHTHNNPSIYDVECPNKFLYPFDLGHQYLTDVVEIQIQEISYDEALATLYALVAAAPSVGIIKSDLDGNLRPNKAIVIYDKVPGGAGHVQRFVDELQEIMETALSIVSNCECSRDTSCYGCIRSFNNQHSHDSLARGHAVDVLTSVLDNV